MRAANATRYPGQVKTLRTKESYIRDGILVFVILFFIPSSNMCMHTLKKYLGPGRKTTWQISWTQGDKISTDYSCKAFISQSDFGLWN